MQSTSQHRPATPPTSRCFGRFAHLGRCALLVLEGHAPCRRSGMLGARAAPERVAGERAELGRKTREEKAQGDGSLSGFGPELGKTEAVLGEERSQHVLMSNMLRSSNLVDMKHRPDQPWGLTLASLLTQVSKVSPQSCPLLESISTSRCACFRKGARTCKWLAVHLGSFCKLLKFYSDDFFSTSHTRTLRKERERARITVGLYLCGTIYNPAL